jgi:ABC-type multidrug transport system ATPase subunit
MLLTLKAATFAVGERRLLGPLSLTLQGGACTALLGANGSGKTTLLRIAAGLLAPTTGLRTGLAPTAIGYCPQADPLWPDLTATEQLQIVGGLHGLASGQAAARATELLDCLDLAPHASKQASTLSGGMRRRLSVATALVHRPRLLLLDEPFAGLDTAQTARLEALLREEAAAGAAVVVATHDLEQAARIADRLLLLDEGRLLHDGTLDALRIGRPSHRLLLTLRDDRRSEVAEALRATALQVRTTDEGLAVSGRSVAELQAIAATLTTQRTNDLLGLEIRPATLDDLLDELRP